MDYITIIVLVFSFLAVLDRIFGSRFGLAKEFEKAFMLLGNMSLSMIGMIVLAPAIAEAIKPVSEFVSEVLKLDSSIIPASLFANDMGGAPLAVEMAQNGKVGLYNALVVSSMMGVTVSFTIPFALGVVNKNCHNELLMGLLCGIVTVPIGCFVSGLMCSLPMGELVKNIVPLIIFSSVVAVCMFLFPEASVRVFKVIGIFITILISIGLYVGIYEFLTGKALIKNIAPVQDGVSICFNAAVVLSGAFSLGSHLAFTMAFDKSYIVPVVVGKIIAGITALILAAFIYERTQKKV